MAAKKTETDSDNPTPKEVWNTLSSINVNEHTESKMNLTYLSWAWAWKILKDNYPNATYAFRHRHGVGGAGGLTQPLTETMEYTEEEGVIDYMQYPDGSGAVHCTIFIGKHVKESMWLPIMDNRNNAIIGPNARQISDAKMRCLVKCISMLGLGLYIYAGEDLPDHYDGSSDESSQLPGGKEGDSSDGPDGKVSLALITFANESESIKELNKFFRDNREVIDKIEISKPEEYAKIISAFSSRKKTLS